MGGINTGLQRPILDKKNYFNETMRDVTMKGVLFILKQINKKVRPRRFERLTYWLEVSCSIQLSYGRIKCKAIYTKKHVLPSLSK